MPNRSQLKPYSIQVNKAGLQFRKLKANFGIAKEGALRVFYFGNMVLDFATIRFLSANAFCLNSLPSSYDVILNLLILTEVASLSTIVDALKTDCTGIGGVSGGD